MFDVLRACLARLVHRRPRLGVVSGGARPPSLSQTEKSDSEVQHLPEADAETLLPRANAAVGESDGEEEDENVGDDEDETGDSEGTDPFISTITEPRLDQRSLADQRAAALMDALSGQHKIFVSTPAGPGSLAEALIGLLAEDRVKAEFVERTDEEPYLLYTPIDPSQD